MNDDQPLSPNHIAGNGTNHFFFRTPGDPKYFYIAIASLVVFFLISIITTVLLCITLKNEPIQWEEADPEKSPDNAEEEEPDEMQEEQEIRDADAQVQQVQETAIGRMHNEINI